MDFGAAIFFTDYSIGPTELGVALEARGVESLWAPEHSHIPLSRRTPFPQGGELPKKYYDVMDPFVTLAAAASATRRLRVATGVCLVVQRDPIQTAKQVASLDQISSGRVLFGIGAGWNAEEMADHGTDFKSRFALMRERVEAMKTIWTKSKPEYHGAFVDFPPMMTWPKPVQKPHPPVIVGGAFPYGARRAIEVSHWHSLYDAAYLRLLAGMDDVQLVGLHDPDAVVVAERAAAVGAPPVFTDYRAMLEKTRPDFVVALGAHARMAETAQYLLDHGYPFMMEKPMGVCAAEVEAIAA